jgi:hypothetical protein
MKIGAKIRIVKKSKAKANKKNKVEKGIEDPNLDTSQFEDITDEEVLRNIP